MDQLQENQKQQQQQPSPVYEIHLHWILGEGAPPVAERVGRSPASSRSAEQEKIADAARGGDSSPRSSTGQSETGERRRLVVIAGSAGGWVTVWHGDGLVASAGVDE